jgi:hypothetical protein
VWQTCNSGEISGPGVGGSPTRPDSDYSCRDSILRAQIRQPEQSGPAGPAVSRKHEQVRCLGLARTVAKCFESSNEEKYADEQEATDNKQRPVANVETK